MSILSAALTHTPANFASTPALPADMPGGCVMRSITIPGARQLPPAALTEATRQAYDTLRKNLQSAGGPHIVRLWNFIPALLEPTGPGTNRYMAFNAGRFAAMQQWFGDDMSTAAPAGTGVGAPGDDLIIHGLACPTPGTAVQNPRQILPMHYSRRYGPRPPCFARATRVGKLLLVSGTAGINGEDTVAPDDLLQQLSLTLEHLAALAGGLNAYGSLTAYVPRESDVAAVMETLRTQLPASCAIQSVTTDLCRPELRVEIEGVAVQSEPA